jgi:hypothetical protein
MDQNWAKKMNIANKERENLARIVWLLIDAGMVGKDGRWTVVGYTGFCCHTVVKKYFSCSVDIAFPTACH